MSQRNENAAANEAAPTTPEEAANRPPEEDAAGHTSVMGFDDLEEFRRAARDARMCETEADRVTPTAPTPSPFAQSHLRPPNPPPTTHEPSATPSDVSAQPPRRFAAIQAAAARSFREASWPKRATVVLMPFVVGLFAVNAFQRPVIPTRAAKTAPAIGAASAQPIASLAADQAGLTAPTSKTGNAPLARASGGVEAHPAGLTLQRRAVDAFAAGNFQEAAALYQRLAVESPNQPAYAAASQIAHDKARGLGHE